MDVSHSLNIQNILVIIIDFIEMAGCVRSFGKDLQNLATGADQPRIGG